jgi:hypothetical protein
MSARKSWDIAPRRSGAQPPSRTARRVEMTRPANPRPPQTVRRVKSAPRQSPLRTKRQKERKLAWIGFAALFLVLLSIIVYVLWLPMLRIQTVEAEGVDEEGIAAVAKGALEGRVFGILPRSSIFLIPESDIRARVMDAYPSVQAVSISATGLTTLTVKALSRTNAFVWCGESITAPATTCYEADADGLIFAPHVIEQASTTATTTKSAGELLVYGPLEGVTDSLIRAHVTYASALPGALKFIKAMRGLSADIGSVTLRGDEVDLHTRAGTRITYVIGKEGEAAILAATSFPSLNLNNGSIEYVDLRFQNKVYLKRRGEAAAE